MSDSTLLPAVIKETGVKQRSDVTLTLPIASAMVAKILSEGKLYTEDGSPIQLTIQEGNEEKAIEVKDATLRGWIYREVVIPEDGRKLRDVLDEARETRKRREREARQLDIIETGEKALHELVNIPITAGKTIETRFRKSKKGFLAYSKVETEFQGVNPKLAEAKIKALTFGLERLEPGRYGSKSEVKNTHLVFSLGDLRRAKERRDELITEAA